MQRVRQGPRRIVCLTEDPAEILCALGEEDRIVGISAYTVRPPGLRQRKPVVSAFIDGSVRKILALEPDLVIGFSDIQADLAAKLIRAQLQVLVFNQRSISEILDVVDALGRLVNAQKRAQVLIDGYLHILARATERSAAQQHRPRVYFEEWDDPQICGIQWVSELIEVAGGQDIFSQRALGKGAKDRFVTMDEVRAGNPDAMIASWCGKAFDREATLLRAGTSKIPAFQNGALYEMDPAIILQPGPAAITDGLKVLESIIRPLAEGATPLFRET